MRPSLLTSPGIDIKLNRSLALSFLETVGRPGIDSLLDYLLESDYFTAPASTVYHDAAPGGLCRHSLNVMFAFAEANQNMSSPIPPESVIICGLLHDLCKVNAYTKTTSGYVRVKGLKGHATLSISRIHEHMELTPQEDDIIRFHMGLFGIFTYREHDTLAIHKAIMRTPQAQIFAAVDMLDSRMP